MGKIEIVDDCLISVRILYKAGRTVPNFVSPWSQKASDAGRKVLGIEVEGCTDDDVFYYLHETVLPSQAKPFQLQF